MQQIRRKAHFYTLYEQGVFGNKLRTWTTVQAFADASYHGLAVLRYCGRGGGTDLPCYGQQLSRADLLATSRLWTGAPHHADPSLIRVNEAAPDDDLTVQGEIARTEGFYELRYCCDPVQMRVAMERATIVRGLTARGILEYYLDPASYQEIMLLLDTYDAVVEFSTYRQCLGDVPHRNTIFWEIRSY